MVEGSIFMKRLLTFICVALICASGAVVAQAAGKIALSTTVDGAGCNIFNTSGIVEVHVVVLDVENFDGIQFAAPKPDCWTGATYLEEEVYGLLFLGDTQDTRLGLSVVWGSCGKGGLTGPINVATIRYETMGIAPVCCPYPILKAQYDAHPEIAGPIIVVCEDPLRVAGVTVDAVINPEVGCMCAVTLPTHETTWGAIKSLYVD
jgi:hypothetical protein